MEQQRLFIHMLVDRATWNLPAWSGSIPFAANLPCISSRELTRWPVARHGTRLIDS
jgi:hypothetical protein